VDATAAAAASRPVERWAEQDQGRGRQMGDDEGDDGATTPDMTRAQPRPERFIVTERPPREHGERYQHVPGTEDVRGDVGALVDQLHALFAHDRVVASQAGAARCGLCYLHFAQSELVYREVEGYYVCSGCAQALGRSRVVMVRRQQRA
jgi:hypothetical protein